MLCNASAWALIGEDPALFVPLAGSTRMKPRRGGAMTADRHCAALVCDAEGRTRFQDLCSRQLARGGSRSHVFRMSRRLTTAAGPKYYPHRRVISRIWTLWLWMLDGGGGTFLKKAHQLTQQCIHQRTQPDRGWRGDVGRISSFLGVIRVKGETYYSYWLFPCFYYFAG